MKDTRLRHSILLLLALALMTAGSTTAHQPPRNLHQVGDHWTAWNPPTSFPEGAEVYTIERGDTLWDLAARFYGNSYLWPQLWERNPYILDAHWIYSGDPLVINIQVTPIEQLAAIGDQSPQEDDGGLRLDESIRPPEPLGWESDITCSGFIGDRNETFPSRISGSEYEALMPNLNPSERLTGDSAYGSLATLKFDLTTGDIVYLDGGLSSGILPGTIHQVVTAEEQVTHPLSRKTLGRFYRFSGQVRILSAQEDTSIAEIVQTCAPINVGDQLRPFEESPVPLARRGRPVGVNEHVAAEQLKDLPVIVRSEEKLFTLGQDHVVYIDRGGDAVAPGDIFTIYRPSKKGLPAVVIGELGVLAAHQNSAVAKILDSRYPVYVGDRLVLKP